MFEKPTPADAKLRYPDLATVDNTVWQYWLTDAERNVDQSWGADYQPGLISLAAHRLTKAGAGPSAAIGDIPAGLTSFRSGNMSLSFSDSAASQSAAGGYDTTKYGQEWAEMARKRSAGGFTTGGGVVACGGYRDRPVA